MHRSTSGHRGRADARHSGATLTRVFAVAQFSLGTYSLSIALALLIYWIVGPGPSPGDWASPGATTESWIPDFLTMAMMAELVAVVLLCLALLLRFDEVLRSAFWLLGFAETVIAGVLMTPYAMWQLRFWFGE